MKTLKNIPETPTKMASLLDIIPGQVESMALSRVEHTQMTLLSIPKGEAISEEEYSGDVMYLCLEGDLIIDGNVLQPGDCQRLSAREVHAVGTENGVKYLQIIVKED